MARRYVSRSTSDRSAPSSSKSSQKETDLSSTSCAEPEGVTFLQLRALAEQEIRRRELEKDAETTKLLKFWSENFIEFAKVLDVIDKTGRRIKVQRSPILTEFESNRTGRDYVLKARQVYFTTWELARDIWYFICKPGSRVLVLCHSQDDNSPIKNISARIDTLFEGLSAMHPEIHFEKNSQIQWTRQHPNSIDKSELRIMSAGATLAAAEKKGRSGMIQRLHVTEVSFFEYAQETLSSILACVPVQEAGSEITFESTPRGAIGVFYEGYHTAKAGRSAYQAHLFQWFKQPEYRISLKEGESIQADNDREKELVDRFNITPEQLKWYRLQVNDPSWGQAKVNQEYISDDVTCWLFDGRVFFEQNDLLRLRAAVTPPVLTHHNGAYKVWVPPAVGKQYIVAVDPSGGEGGDPSALIVFERGTGTYCAKMKGQFRPDVLAKYAAGIAVAYNMATIAHERNNHGHMFNLALEKWQRNNHKGESIGGVGYSNVYHGPDKKPGFNTSASSRPMILESLEAAIRGRMFNPPDIEWIEEAFLFIVKDEKPEHAPGANDDQIICAAIGWHLCNVAIGLHHRQFAQAPSIAYEQTPISFEGMVSSVPTIDNIVENEQKRWAQGNPEPQPTNQGWYIISTGSESSTSGF